MITKKKISVTISSILFRELEESVELTGLNKSSIMELALKSYLASRLVDEAKKIASIKFDDLPSEEDWLILQNEAN
ncbi:MAG: metal-responsive CopG/Arc/MetJ family transcriptional regulator [Oceanicoccus sp.]|jgi:metal-responsive CopG/Arc/MetJ family transcriptional regulator